MIKWLVAAGCVVVVLLILLWLQIDAPEPTRVATESASVFASNSETAPDVVRKHQLAAIAAQVVAVGSEEGKVSPDSDEFFHRFYDRQPAVLTRNAAKCYTGGLGRVHRNAKVKLVFTNRISDGEVSVENVAVSPDTTIDDQRLVDCFVREVKGTRWRDDALPDWSGPDELVLRPERGMKKYSQESLNYTGSGPDFTPSVSNESAR